MSWEKIGNLRGPKGDPGPALDPQHAHPEYAVVDDPRLSDARPAIPHQHAYADPDHTHPSHAHPYASDSHAHPGTYSVLDHGHTFGDTSGLQGALDAKAAAGHNHDGSYAATHAHPYAATAHAHDYAATSHTHVSDIPAGLIVMWSGALASIPGGWVLCDGQNGTPDLRDRFIRGAAAGAAGGATGGAATHGHTFTQPTATPEAVHTHTYTQVPNHVHVQTVNSATTGGLSGYTPDASSNTPAVSGYSTQNPTGGVATGTTAGGSSHTHAMSGGAVADGSSLPPFFALAFIMKAA